MTGGLLDARPAEAAEAPAERTTAVRGHTPASVWRRLRGPLLVLGLLALLALVTLVVGGQPREGLLDPRATTPDGTHALAALLEDRGVDVQRVTTVEEALAGDPATVVLPFPEALPDSALRRIADSGVVVVALGPAQASLPHLAPGLEVAGSTGVAVRPPGCELHSGRVAGPVEIGGLTYDTSGVELDLVACYEAAGGPLLVEVARPGGGATLVLGDGEPLTNRRLAAEGNAALGLSLLGGGEQVRWLVPVPGAVAPEEERSLVDLLPPGVRAALVLLAVSAVLAALWRARRLGPVVAEPLPVVVRAAEAVEGRARLYRSARARDRAAESLREAARTRLAPVAGAGPDPQPGTLVAGVAERVGVDGVEVERLLYGPVPADDRALVRLASDLDALEARVRAGTAPAVPAPGSARPAAPSSERGIA